MRLDDHDERGFGRGRQVVGEIADPARDQQPDIRLAAAGRPEPGGAHRLVEARGDLIVAEGHRQVEHRGRRPQPAHVAVEEKRLAVVSAQRLVDSFAEQKPVVEDRNDRVRFVCDAAVDVHHAPSTQ